MAIPKDEIVPLARGEIEKINVLNESDGSKVLKVCRNGSAIINKQIIANEKNELDNFKLKFILYYFTSKQFSHKNYHY